MSAHAHEVASAHAQPDVLMRRLTSHVASAYLLASLPHTTSLAYSRRLHVPTSVAIVSCSSPQAACHLNGSILVVGCVAACASPRAELTYADVWQHAADGEPGRHTHEHPDRGAGHRGIQAAPCAALRPRRPLLRARPAVPSTSPTSSFYFIIFNLFSITKALDCAKAALSRIVSRGAATV